MVAHAAAQKISVINTATWRVTTMVPTAGTPNIVEVDDRGFAYYSGDFGVERIDLRSGIGDPGLFGAGYEPGAVLTSDGKFLYTGDSGVIGGNLFKYDISGGSAVQIDRTTYNNRSGFLSTERQIYLSPGGRHIYYADFQLDAGALDFASGHPGETIYAEDARESFAIGANHVFDAALVRPVATLPHKAIAAALTAGDQELWYYSAATGRIYYQNTADLVGGVALGVHEVPPGPLSSYSFAELIHDPVRPRLYGLDTTRATVVVIDAVSLQPTQAILLGSAPADLAIDAAGTTLFVGHLDVQGFARIKLDTLTFDGMVVAPRDTYRIASVGGGRVVTLDFDQWNTPSLLDARTGAVLSEGGLFYEGALAATPDGAAVFVGESGTSGGRVTRYSVTTDQLVVTGDSGRAFYCPPRSTTVLPDGSGVYYDGYLLDGNNPTVQRYEIGEPILAVSPDGRVALSSSKVYEVATGRRLGALPVTTSALAISPDGTKAFLFAGGVIRSVDLSAF